MQTVFTFVSAHLTFVAVVVSVLGGFLIIFVLFLRRLEERVEELRSAQDDVQGRVIGLEVKEFTQDDRLEEHDSTLKTHAKFMVKTRRDVDELGHDIGWEDGKRKTQVMPPVTTQNLIDELKKPKE